MEFAGMDGDALAQARDGVKALVSSLDKLDTSPLLGRASYQEPKLTGDFFAVGIAHGFNDAITWYEFHPELEAQIGSTVAADVIAAAKALQAQTFQLGK